MCATQNPDRDQWDVIVIGGGPPGETAAQYASQFSGLSAVVVEQERLGGECEFWACRPSKALLLVVETRNLAANLPGVREITGDRVDVAATLARRDDMASHYDDAEDVEWMAANNLDLLRGHGRIAGPKTVTVTAADGTTRTITARHAVVLATGTTARVPPITGLAAARPWISRDVTSLREVPRRVVVIGGGAVGCESATWLNGLGADVTILHRGTALLGAVEPFAADIVLRQFQQAGVDVQFNTTVTDVARDGAQDRGRGMMRGATATLTLSNGKQMDVDEIVVATGRRPNSDDLGLDTIDMSTSHGFVEVDDHLTVTGTDWLYAVGDLTGRALLTHMGKYQGRIAGAVIRARAHGQPLDERPYNAVTSIADHRAVPQVVFTDPQVASVGLTEAQARDQGMDVQTAEYDLAGIAGATLLRENYEGRAKIVVDRGTDTLVGVTFVGSGTTDLLHSATVAVVGRVPIAALAHAVPSFPTITEIWLRLLEDLEQRRRSG